MKSRFLIALALLGLFSCTATPEDLPAEEPLAQLPPPTELIEALTQAPAVTDRFAANSLIIEDQVMERAPRLYNFQDIPDGWVSEPQLAQLMQLIDSDVDCYLPVPDDCSSNATATTATKGFLARQLLTSYINNWEYKLESQPAAPPMSAEALREWWKTQTADAG